jgi:hypothetical protein
MDSSDDSDASSDDEFWTVVTTYVEWELQRRPRVMRDRSNPINDYNDVEFRQRFRLPKQTVIELCVRLQDILAYRTRRHGQISVMNKILVTLRFLASGSFLVGIAMMYLIFCNDASSLIVFVTTVV